MTQMNGNARRSHNRIPSTSAQHNDIIDYIFESWKKVSSELDRNSGNGVVYYHEQNRTNLKDFQPFDLESFVGQRFMYSFQRS